VPADAVFPAAAGHVTQLLVRTGDRVSAGQPIALLSDDGTSAGGLLQARSDFDTARLELAQKSVHDPLRGPSPTDAEMRAARQAVVSAQAKLGTVLGPPLPTEVATARLDVAKARADLRAARAGTPAALAAAQFAVATAEHKLRTLTGNPNASDVAGAQLELAKATVDQEALLRQPAGPSASSVQAADLAVALAQRQLSDAMASGTATDQAAARAQLAKVQAERDALLARPAGPSEAARSASQLAVDAARRRLADLTTPPPGMVTAARAELLKARADLAALRSTRGAPGLGAARAAVGAAAAKLAQVLRGPRNDVVTAARLDLRKAQADHAVLVQRAGPATPFDLALARLKVDVARQRVGLAQELARRLTVVAGASGTVTSVLTTAGAAVDPTTPVARVQDLGHLVVTLDLSEFDVGRIRMGAPARVSVDALGGRRYTGSVLDIALSGVESGGVVNFPVIVDLDSGRALRPGMSVSAQIVVASRPHVVRVPVDAVRDRADHPTVMVRSASGKLVPRPVELGLTGGRHVEVRSGLQGGERVLAATGE
jgi:RND family efflux transporter MFP subunit